MATHYDINASSIEKRVIDSIEQAVPPPSSSARIPRVPKILLWQKSDIYEKCYVPKVVSIGPYHYNNPKLELLEKLKPVFTKKLLSTYNVGLNTLYKKLGGENMVQELRKFYEEKSTDEFSDEVFIKMMLLDGCFILYYILFIYGVTPESCGELRSHQIVFIQQDLFLLENQIPYIVVQEVMNLIKLNHRSDQKIQSFFTDNILLSGKQKKGCFGFGSCPSQNDQNSGQDQSQKSSKVSADHLLHHLHSILTRTIVLQKSPQENTSIKTKRHQDTKKDINISNGCTFRNVTELVDVGIHFKPSSVMSLAHVEFVGSWWWWFSADLLLPPITVDDSTKSMLLNLIAYEMCSDDAHAWVTSYICLLDSLIDQPEDVKALRKAGVLDNSLGSDKEVATLFNEIGTDLVPNNLAYLEAKKKIQRRYESLRNTWLSQLKHEYIKSPWSFLALLGAVMALFLSGVQTYFTVWGPKGECDDLCMFLKINHHL